MKKILLPIGAFFFLMATVKAQIPNPSFETWTSGNPDSWTTGNINNFISVTQDPSAHAGSSAAKLSVISIGGPNTIGGTLSSLEFPQNIVKPALHGWYKGNFNGGDLLYATCSVSTADDVMLASGYLEFTQNTSTYTEFGINLTIIASGVPSKASIVFMLAGPGNSPVAAHVGSYAFLDDLSWGAAVITSVEENNTASFNIEKIFPNPATGDISFVQYYLPEPAKVEIEVYDIAGHLVQQSLLGEQGQGHYRADIATADLAPGMYAVRVNAGGQSQSMMLIK